MAIYVNYQSEFILQSEKQFDFLSSTNVKWALSEKWFWNEPCYFIKIFCNEDQPLYHNFYADVEIYTLKKHFLLKQSAKGSVRIIEMAFNLSDFIVAFSNLYRKKIEYSPGAIAQLMTDNKFQIEIKLSPILKFVSLSEFDYERGIASKIRRRLRLDVGRLLNDSNLDFLYDIEIISGVARVKAHKNILSVRLAELCPKLNRSELKTEKGLEKIVLNESMAANLRSLVYFLYTDEVPETSTENADILKKRFLEAIVDEEFDSTHEISNS